MNVTKNTLSGCSYTKHTYVMIYEIYNLRRLDSFHQIKRKNRSYVAPQPYHKINLAPGEMKTLFVPFFMQRECQLYRIIHKFIHDFPNEK